MSFAALGHIADDRLVVSLVPCDEKNHRHKHHMAKDVFTQPVLATVTIFSARKIDRILPSIAK
jgi:hypothetical protein